MPSYCLLSRCLLFCFLGVVPLSLTAQYSLAPSLQVHAGRAQFWAEDIRGGGAYFARNEYRRIPAWTVGLAFQKPLRHKVAFQASWYYLRTNELYTESYWNSYERSGIDLGENVTSAPHSLQLTHLNLQIYVQQHGFRKETVELGIGFAGSLNQQYYRSSFIFNEQLMQLEVQEFTDRRDVDFGVSMNIRVSFWMRE